MMKNICVTGFGGSQVDGVEGQPSLHTIDLTPTVRNRMFPPKGNILFRTSLTKSTSQSITSNGQAAIFHATGTSVFGRSTNSTEFQFRVASYSDIDDSQFDAVITFLLQYQQQISENQTTQGQLFS